MRPNIVDRYLGVTFGIESALQEGDYDAVQALLDSRSMLIDQLESVKGILEPKDWELVMNSDSRVQKALEIEKNSISRMLLDSQMKSRAAQAYRRG